MKNDKVFKINPKAAPRGFRNPVSRFLVEHAVGFPKLDRIVTEARALQRQGVEPDFNAAILKGMNLHVELEEADFANIPKEGPVILVSNHPFGGIEGVVLLDILRRARPDFKVMANYYLDAIPEMRKDFIFVNPFGSAAAAKQNIRPLLECVRWLKEGHILGVFPSGEVSSIDLKRRLVRDPPWSESIAALARKTGATVVPMHFCGRNPALFQLAGLVHPRLRTVLLPRMTARQRRRTITAFIGKPVTPGEIARVESDKELTRLLRLRSYALEGRAPAKKKLLHLPRRKPAAALAGPREEIISETPREEIEAALAALPKDSFLLSGSGLDVYMAPLAPDNPIMRELGRLREITFRAVGEGTGRSTDVDVYDPHYRHLFLWDPKERRLVGAYRLGLAPEIVPKFGVEGLYTHSLFRYSKQLIDRCQPCIEMGRSFVRPEYQRAFAPLMMLWKGIGAFIARNPDYHSLFGPVSISSAYRDESRSMLLRSLRLSNFAGELARFVRPLRPPRRGRRAEWKGKDYEEMIANTDLVSSIISDLESDKKGIPILVKQYLKLGGRILAFNVDPDFGDCLDGLILVDLRRTDAKVRAHYMGADADAAFRAHHKLD
jgi:putative hemolysin